MADMMLYSAYTEAFAQVGVMAFYNANVGSIWDWNVGCMADQVGRTIELLGDSVVYSSSRNCNRVWAHRYVQKALSTWIKILANLDFVAALQFVWGLRLGIVATVPTSRLHQLLQTPASPLWRVRLLRMRSLSL